jgi:hypothetical protein
MSESGAIATATALAHALDREDYHTARALLADECGYAIREQRIDGADAIINSYQTNADAGRRQFDDVRFESAVSAISTNEARIDYTDYVECAGEKLVHRCAQLVTVDDTGKVTAITHVDLPGEREKLVAFSAKHC